MTECKTCGCWLPQWGGVLVNEWTPDKFVQCEDCHSDSLDSGEITQCDECGMYFTPDNLGSDPETGEQELCPYCGRVWCK